VDRGIKRYIHREEERNWICLCRAVYSSTLPQLKERNSFPGKGKSRLRSQLKGTTTSRRAESSNCFSFERGKSSQNMGREKKISWEKKTQLEGKEERALSSGEKS